MIQERVVANILHMKNIEKLPKICKKTSLALSLYIAAKRKRQHGNLCGKVLACVIQTTHQPWASRYLMS